MALSKESNFVMHRIGDNEAGEPENYLDSLTGEHLIPKYERFCTNYVTHFDQRKAMEACGYPVDERDDRTVLTAFRNVWARKDIQMRIRALIREVSEHRGIGPDWVVMKWMEVVDEGFKQIPITNAEGDVIGYRAQDLRSANQALDMIAKYFSMYKKRDTDRKPALIQMNFDGDAKPPKSVTIDGETSEVPKLQ